MNRITAAAGIVSPVLIVLGIILLVHEEIDTRSDQEIVDHYAGSGNRVVELTGFFGVVVGAILFIVFLSALRSRLQTSGPEPWVPAHLAQHAGTAAAALLIAASALLASTSFAVEFDADFVVDPDAARLALSTGYLLLLGWMLVSLVSVIATAGLALRTSILPRWLGWVSVAAVPLAIAEAVLFPVFVVPAWVLATSLALLLRPTTATSPG